jgi:hypothetical protein
MKKPAQDTVITHIYNYHLPNIVTVVMFTFFADRNSTLTVLLSIYQTYW